MALKDHPDYEQEIIRLAETIEYMENVLAAAEQNKAEYRAGIKEAFVELDFLDSSQSYVSILVNSKLLEMVDKNYHQLLRVKDKPYFARIDLRHERDPHARKYYIGKMSLTRKGDSDPLIVDWRAPIASVYYDGRLGEISYDSPSGTRTGDLSLKRQYSIEKGRLDDIMDIDITATDAFLQASLGANADTRLKEIVSTIQGEQNAIIRADLSKPLIVQGAAGSGKTTIALHRIAYLIYNYEETFDPENFMIIAPNRLFLSYISEVLPELGVDRVRQTTFIDFIYEITGIKYKLTSVDEKLLRFITEPEAEEDDNNNLLLKAAAALKGSLAFKDMLDIYISDIERCFVPDEDFALEGYTIMGKSEIEGLFLKDYSYRPIYKRIDSIKQMLTARLKGEKKKILEGLESEYDKRIEQLRLQMEESEERRQKIISLIEKRDSLLSTIKKGSMSLVKKYLSRFPKAELMQYYREVYAKMGALHQKTDYQLYPELLTFICRDTLNRLDKKQLEFEDLAAVAYLKYKVFGFDKEIDIKYMVIDEAQDFSLFQLYLLKMISNTELFTILGDLSQSIHSYRAVDHWQEVSSRIFTSGNARYLTLEQSYRTTVEIMDLANEIIKQWEGVGMVLARPVVRHGERPMVNTGSSTNEIIDSVEKQIQQARSEGFKSIAIIGKTMKDCTLIKKQLDKRGIHSRLLKGEEAEYGQNITIVPSYTAKGLEFDVVIIVCIDEKYDKTELDIKLLYVALTRALHKVYIDYKPGSITPIDKVNMEFYQIEQVPLSV